MALEKLGYFFMGCGTGILAMGYLSEAGAFDEPEEIVDEEDAFELFVPSLPCKEENVTPYVYLSSSDEENSKLEDGGRSKNIREAIAKRRFDAKVAESIKYKKGRIFNDNDKKNLSETFMSEKIPLDFLQEDDEFDHPEEDAPEDSDYVVDAVEPGFDVYLSENPMDFITLSYYQGDSTLCDDHEQIINNPEDVIGHVAIERLVTGGPGAEEGVIYVRNRKTMLNFEVVLNLGSYSETVLGIFESRVKNGSGGDVDN